MKKMQKIFSSIGTLNNITVFFEDNRSEEVKVIMKNIEDYFYKLDDNFSIFKENSEINKINKNAGIKFVEVEKDTFEIIKIAKEYGKITNGAFDITIKPLVDLWNEAKKKNLIPSDKKVKEILRLINYNDIIINEKDQSVMLKNKGQSIDLGGIAKGYIIDKVKDILKINNIDNAIINLGGTVSSIGEKRNIGIRNPYTPINASTDASIFASIESIDEDVITSGIYEQFFKKDKKIYHHILSSKTGYPTQTQIISATIIGKCGAELDALATACFILGIGNSVKLLKKRNLEAIFIIEGGKIFVTEGLKEKIKVEGEK